MATVQDGLNELAGTATYISSQDAANELAETTDLSVQGALQTEYTLTGSRQDVVNQQIVILNVILSTTDVGAEKNAYSVANGLQEIIALNILVAEL